MQELMRVFDQTDKLLSRPALFAQIVSARLKLDIAHFAQSQTAMADQQREILSQLQRIAYVMSMRGVYELTTTELEDILHDKEGIRLVMFGTVFMRKQGFHNL